MLLLFSAMHNVMTSGCQQVGILQLSQYSYYYCEQNYMIQPHLCNVSY